MVAAMTAKRGGTMFKDMICGQTFTKDSLRWVKVAHRAGGSGLAYQLNAAGMAMPSVKREFFPETVVVEVK